MFGFSISVFSGSLVIAIFYFFFGQILIIFACSCFTGSGGGVRGGGLAEMAGVERELFASTDEPELEFDEDGTELSSSKEGELVWT